MTGLITYPDRDALMSGLASVLADALRAALARQEAVSLAVPGGTTPGPLFDRLGAVDLDWARVTVLLGDERWLPESAPRSNAALVRARLLQGPAAAARFVPFYRPDQTAETAMGPLANLLAPSLPISVLLLGMGADMHTASLFPGADRLAEALAEDAPPLMALRAAGAPEPRISLTAPVLRGAQVTHLLITGPEKRAALDEARRRDDPLAAPVSLVLPQATVHWAE